MQIVHILRLAIVSQTARRIIPRRVHLPSIALDFSERKLLLAIVDLSIVNMALLVALAMRTDMDVFRWETVVPMVWDRVGWFILLSGLWLLIGSFLDIYDLARAASASQSFAVTSGAALLTIFIYYFIPFITPSLPIRRVEALILPVVAIVGVGFWRLGYATIFVQPRFQQIALMVGAGWAGRTLVRAISELGDKDGNPYRGTGYRIIGFIDDEESKQGKEVEGIPVLGTRHDLVNLARQLNPNELIVAITDSQKMHSDLFQAIMDCREMGIHITDMPTIYERLTGRVPIEHAGRNLYVVMPMGQPATYRFYLLFKRLVDISAGVIGCILLVLIAPFVWLCNRISAPGSLFYWQQRRGKGGQLFSLVKFRSMVIDAEEASGAVWAADNDSRVTPVGRFLRKTRLDELPQFWNILRAEMSLVGPRPERPEFVAELAKQIPFYQTRHAVKPGLTGWAQINYRYGASSEDALIKLQYDLYYIKHQGILLDLQVIFKTIGVVLRLRGR